MRVVLVKKQPLNACRHCQRAILRGDVAFHQRMPNNPFGDRDMFFHADCLAKLLRDAAEANTAIAQKAAEIFEESVAEIRERMIETGDVFVDC